MNAIGLLEGLIFNKDILDLKLERGYVTAAIHEHLLENISIVYIDNKLKARLKKNVDNFLDMGYAGINSYSGIESILAEQYNKKDFELLYVQKARPQVKRNILIETKVNTWTNGSYGMLQTVPITKNQLELFLEKFEAEDDEYIKDSGFIIVFRNKSDLVLFELTNGFNVLNNDA